MLHRTTALALTLAGACTMTLADAPEPLPPIESVEVGPNREVLVNGEPFLPIMSWAQNQRNLPEFRSLHFNTFAGSHGGSAAELARAAQDAGGYLAMDIANAEQIPGNPRVLMWMHRDEPDMPQRPDDDQLATPDLIEAQRGTEPSGFVPKQPPAETLQRYERVKQIDPSRPVAVTFTGHFFELVSHYNPAEREHLYGEYVQHADILGFDIYPIYGHGRPAWLNVPAQATEQLVAMGGHAKPVYTFIETSKGSRWMTYERQPDVLPIHTRFQVWGSIIRGATAIAYFTHAWQPSFSEFAATDEMKAELGRLNAQLTRLTRPILAAETDRRIEMTMPGELEGHFKATEHDGYLYIFAQNTDLGPGADEAGQFDPIRPRGGTGRFTVEGLAAGTAIEVVDEDRTITAEDGSFADDFDPLAEHIYRIPLDR